MFLVTLRERERREREKGDADEACKVHIRCESIGI